jgi:hypothetical protein
MRRDGDAHLRPSVDAATMARLRNVHDLADITDFMVFRANPDERAAAALTFDRDLRVEVAANRLFTLLDLAGLAAGVTVVALVGHAFGGPRRYRFEGGGAEQTISLGLLGRATIAAPDGRPLGTLRRRFGRIWLEPSDPSHPPMRFTSQRDGWTCSGEYALHPAVGDPSAHHEEVLL